MYGEIKIWLLGLNEKVEQRQFLLDELMKKKEGPVSPKWDWGDKSGVDWETFAVVNQFYRKKGSVTANPFINYGLGEARHPNVLLNALHLFW